MPKRPFEIFPRYATRTKDGQLFTSDIDDGRLDTDLAGQLIVSADVDDERMREGSPLDRDDALDGADVSASAPRPPSRSTRAACSMSSALPIGRGGFSPRPAPW